MVVVAAGPISKYSTTAIVNVLPSLKKIVVFDINEDASRRFAEEMSARFDIDVSPVSSLAEAVKGQDIVTSATSGSATPLFEDKWLKEGSLLTLPGRGQC